MTGDFVPQFKSRIPGKPNSKDWLDFEEPQIHLFQGMRGSGKGGMVDSTAEKLYKQGIRPSILFLQHNSYKNFMSQMQTK